MLQPFIYFYTGIGAFRNSLCKGYKRTRYTKKGEWPPNQPESIVNVALIHYKGKRTQQQLIEIAKLHKEGSIAGDPLDKLSSESQLPSAKRPRLDHSKITKKITDIFTTDSSDHACEPPKRILIEGAPGIGKTVLVKEIAYRWANDELLQSVDLVILLYLRDPRLQSVESAEQLFRFYTSSNIASDISDYLHSGNESKVAFLFDGFDEYPAALQKCSFIVDIIEGRCFPDSVVVVTSRPTATVFLHDQVDRRIEILGFEKEEREKYIMHSLSNSPEKKIRLDKYLKQQPTINAFCYVPLHLAVLLYLFNEEKNLPETLTEMNQSFIIHTIYRHLRKNEMDSLGVIKKLSDLPKQVYNIVYKLSQLAFNGLQENKLVFTLNEITNVCPDITDTSGNINGFGLLQTVQHFSKEGVGVTASFNFLHYTMQEFLAAFHVSTLPGEQQSLQMEQTFWDERFNFMWMMYVGIVGAQSNVFSYFISEGNTYKYKNNGGLKLLDDIMRDKRKRLHVFQCYTEAKSNTEVPKVIATMFKDGKVKINSITLLPNHVSSLISFLSHSTVQLSILELRKCHLGDIGMSILKQFTIDNRELVSTLNYVDLMENNSSPWNVYCIIIKHCSVDSLTLCGDNGMEDYVKQIEEGLKMNTALQSLTLYNIKKVGLQSVKEVLVNNNVITLKELNLSWLSGYDKRLNVLLHTNTESSHHVVTGTSFVRVMAINVLWNKADSSTADSLDLSHKCTEEMLLFIAFGLHNNKVLLTLDISSNRRGMTDDVALAILDCLKNNTTLQELNLSNNKLTHRGACIFVRAFEVNKTLQVLDISNNELFDEGTVAVSRSLENNTAIKILNLSNNSFTANGARSIARLLQVNKTIQKLNISNNTISCDGAIAISDCLKNNKSLQDLNISSADIITGEEIMENSTSDEIVENTILIGFINIFHVNSLNISNNIVSSTIISSCIKNNEFLQELNISENQITSDGARKIAEAVTLNSKLQKLDISKNYITSEALVYLLKASNSKLQFLNITCNNVTESEYKQIECCIEALSFPLEVHASWNALVLTSKGLMIKSTIIPFNSYGTPRGTEEDVWSLMKIHPIYRAEFFSNCLKNVNNSHDLMEIIIEVMETNEMLDLSCINLSGINLSDGGAAHIKINNFIQELNLSNNKITGIGARRIVENMYLDTMLCKLNISCNILSDEGAAAISDCLKINNSLKELNLSNNKITSIGAIRIAEAMQLNKILQKLDISCNALSDAGAAAISDCLKINNTLQELNISNNEITSEGATSIGEAMNENSVLLILDISKNWITGETLVYLLKTINSNSGLQYLNITHNNVTKSEYLQIQQCIKQTVCHAHPSLHKICASWNDIVSINENSELKSMICTINSYDIHSSDIDVKEEVWSFNTISNSIYRANFMGNCLKEDDKLQQLKLHNQNINIAEAKLIIYAMQVNPKLMLVMLDISCNTLSDEGAIAISECLKVNSILQELILSHNNITSVGATKIAEAIQLRGTLQKLDISYNTISDEGAIAFSNCLRINNIIEVINLSNNGITSVGAISIAEAMNVNTILLNLDISKNWITSEGLICLLELKNRKSGLQFLNITHNNITKSEFIRIQQCIKQAFLHLLQSLQWLHEIHASWNEIVSINNDTKLVSKICTFYSDEMLSYVTKDVWTIPDSIHGIKLLTNCLKEDHHLLQLDLCNHNINITGAKLIANAIQNNIAIVIMRLDISCNALSDEGAAAISDCLKINHSLKELNLSNNKITSIGAIRIANAMQVNKMLSTLDISCNTLSDEGAAAISDCLKINNNLRVLNLSKNEITSVGAIRIANAMQVNAMLQKLDISCNTLSDEGTAAISDCLKISNNLRELNLSKNEITSVGAIRIAKAMRVNTMLQKLDISCNTLSDEGAAAISDCLKISNNLRELNLSKNEITSVGAIRIAKAMRVNTMLQKLDISCNTLSDEGATAISDCLKISNNLRELNLSKNEITSVGAIRIAEAMHPNTKLYILDISCNTLSDEGAAAISDCLKINNNLRVLNLSKNGITSVGAIRIAEAMQVNKMLSKLDISCNTLSDEGAAAIGNCLMLNSYLREFDLSKN